jgi:hypothetical protein
MAHYAFLDEKNIVVDVIVGKEEGNFDWEQQYATMMGMACKRTSYNTHGGIYYNPETGEPDPDQSKSFRKNFAGIGYTYSFELDGFITIKPYENWVLNTQTCMWEAPIPYPNDGKVYIWNPITNTWDLHGD